VGARREWSAFFVGTVEWLTPVTCMPPNCLLEYWLARYAGSLLGDTQVYIVLGYIRLCNALCVI
jgi:hypothetical protein